MGGWVPKQVPTEGRPKVSSAARPPVHLLLAIDHMYRRQAKAGVLRLVQRHGSDVHCVPVLSMHYGVWQFTVRCHRTFDEVVVCCQDTCRKTTHIAMVTTHPTGWLADKRVVHQRMEECVSYYRRIAPQQRVSISTKIATACAFTTLAFPIASAPLHVSDNISDQKDALQLSNVEAINPPSRTAANTNASIFPSSHTSSPETEPQVSGFYPPVTVMDLSVATIETRGPVQDTAARESAATMESFDVAWRTNTIDVPDGQKRIADVSQEQKALQTVSTDRQRYSRSYGLDQDQVFSIRPRTEKTNKSESFWLRTKFRERNAAIQKSSGNRNSYWDMSVKSGLGRHLSTTGQLGFSSFDPFTLGNLGNDQDRALKLGLKGKLGRFSYGTGYSAIGKEFRSLREKDDNEKDREQMQVWGSWQLGRLGVKTALIEKNSNIHDDPKRPYMTERASRVSLNYQFLDWPSLGYTLSYQDGTRRSSQEPNGYSPYEGTETSVDGSLYFSANKWKASVDSYWVTSDDLSDAEDYRIVGHGLSGSYYPSDDLSVWASVSVADEYYDSDQSHTQTRWVALTVDKALARNGVHFSGYASYYTDTNDTWKLDTEGIYTEAGVFWTLGNRKKNNQGVKLFLSYNLYTDNIFPDSNSNELAAWIVYKFNFNKRSFHRSTYSRMFQEID